MILNTCIKDGCTNKTLKNYCHKCTAEQRLSGRLQTLAMRPWKKCSVDGCNNETQCVICKGCQRAHTTSKIVNKRIQFAKKKREERARQAEIKIQLKDQLLNLRLARLNANRNRARLAEKIKEQGRAVPMPCFVNSSELYEVVA